jgi:hypothetical protein
MHSQEAANMGDSSSATLALDILFAGAGQPNPALPVATSQPSTLPCVQVLVQQCTATDLLLNVAAAP